MSSPLVPRAQRSDWKREWFAELWHRWQFLVEIREWNLRESFKLIRNCLGAPRDAFWQFAAQERVFLRLRSWARLPWSCLGALSLALALLAVVSSGFPATRQILGSTTDSPDRSLLFVWLHPMVGGVDKGVPPEVVPEWRRHSRYLSAAAPFKIDQAALVSPRSSSLAPLVIDTDPSLFKLFPVQPLAGVLPSSPALVLDHRTWVSVFRSNPHIIGSRVQVGPDTYPIAAVLPPSFRFLTRRSSVYLVEPRVFSGSAFVIARARHGVHPDSLLNELGAIAEDLSYYFSPSQLRIASFRTELLMPLGAFSAAVLVSAVLTSIVWRARLHHLAAALRRGHRKAALIRTSFFSAKIGLALLIVFTAVLEASRTESALLFASLDPANGPVLVWFYIIGGMGAFFWAVADQRARCRVCLRWLAFPVRIGCPGCLLLTWSGTELLCSEGHGVLHVPHLAPSWEQESQHWISLDESWQSLFADSK